MEAKYVLSTTLTHDAVFTEAFRAGLEQELAAANATVALVNATTVAMSAIWDDAEAVKSKEPRESLVRKTEDQTPSSDMTLTKRTDPAKVNPHVIDLSLALSKIEFGQRLLAMLMPALENLPLPGEVAPPPSRDEDAPAPQGLEPVAD